MGLRLRTSGMGKSKYGEPGPEAGWSVQEEWRAFGISHENITCRQVVSSPLLDPGVVVKIATQFALWQHKLLHDLHRCGRLESRTKTLPAGTSYLSVRWAMINCWTGIWNLARRHHLRRGHPTLQHAPPCTSSRNSHTESWSVSNYRGTSLVRNTLPP